MTIHPSNTKALNASIAWDIRICERTGYVIEIRSVTVDGVVIAGAELSSGVKEELRDIVRNSPEYEPSDISRLVREMRYEAEMDDRADRAMDERHVERNMAG